jgi:NAD(P)H-nitrite reductase large subunit
VLIGAGFIGCIILEALAERGVDLTVLEMGDRMVPRMMNQTAGNLIKTWCETKGIHVYTSTRVKAIKSLEKPGGVKRVLNAVGIKGAKESSPPSLKVILDSGKELDAHLVISAAGVASNIKFLQGSGVEVDNGVLVNHALQTNVPEIYAAGDVAEGRDFSTGSYAVHAIQPTASDHGRIAGLNMAGVTTSFQGSLNMNVLDTVGLISSSFGLWMGVEGGDSVEICQPERFRYLNLAFQDDMVVGATSLGLTQHVGVLRGLIQGKVHLGEWKHKLMQDPTRIMEAYLAKNYSAQHGA